MRVENRIITIQIDVDEWKMIQKDWSALKYKKHEYNFKDVPALDEFLNVISNVATNQGIKIDNKLGNK